MSGWQQLLGAIIIALVGATGAVLAQRKRPVVDIADATESIVAAARTAVELVTEENQRQALLIAELRRDVKEMQDDLRTARAQISTLKSELAQERVAHDETREQVTNLRELVRRFTDTPPGGNPVVGN